MELRSWQQPQHLHFIKAIKGGLVTKVLSVNRGRPAPKYKNMEDIHDSMDAKNQDLLRMFCPKDDFEGLPFDSDTAERTIITNPEALKFSPSGGDEGQNSDLGDLSFINMTLKHIKERCKAKKRKLSSYVDLSKATAVTFSHAKQEYLNLQLKDEQCDLKQPLSSLKSKLSKNFKGKKDKNCMKNLASSLSQTALSEPISSDHEFLQYVEDFSMPIDVRVVGPEPDYSVCQDMICVAPHPSLGCNEKIDSCGRLSSEVPETGNGRVLVTGVLLSSSKEFQGCDVNVFPYEHRKHAEPKSVYDVGISGWDIVKVDIPVTISQGHPDLPISEFEKEDYSVYPLPIDIYSENISLSKDHSPDLYDTRQCYSSMQEMSLQATSDSQSHMASTAFDNSLLCLEYVDKGSACLCEDETRNDLPSNYETGTSNLVNQSWSTWILNLCSSADSCSISAADNSPSIEEKQSLPSACADTAENCPTAIHPCDASDKLATSAGVGDHQTKLQHPPKKLFPTRKAISPTSQARLCKAMECVELRDNEQYCRGKLYFGRESKNKNIKAEGPGQSRRAEVSVNQEQFGRKPKYFTGGSHPKGILKDPHHSYAIPCFSTGCSSINGCSQSAITFSQRQMRDVECLATRLTKELSSMKDIVKETLFFEAGSATALKHNVDKVTVAIENATKIEESAKRFLSMMARDCSRFCKIMRLSEFDSVASNGVVPKKSKKITFADEAGKELCHVKVFKDDMVCLMESIGE
ncbi:hypothetical protein CFOL_v3_27824, partial [Cephalotus follicularis]